MSFDFSPKDGRGSGFFGPAEKKRFVGMGVAALVLLAGMAYMASSTRKRDDAPRTPSANATPRPQFVETVEKLPIDGSRWNELVRDSSSAERVLLEGPALELALETASKLREQHFEAMSGIEPTPQDLQRLVGDPASSRAVLMRLRGHVEQLEEVPSVQARPSYWRGRLRLENGERVLFAAREVSESGVFEGSFARVDGLFLKLLRNQTDQGGIEAPLFVGSLLRRSYPKLAPVTELDASVGMGVVDDTIDEAMGLQPEEYWRLVSYVSNLSPDSVDWERAPLLDREFVAALAEKGENYRFRPVRIPPCTVLDIWSQAQGENPLRIERLTEGWLGLQTWIGPTNGVVYFSTPAAPNGIKRGDLVVANAFFYKHYAYETDRGALAIAPLLVVSSIQPSLPPDQSAWRMMLVVFGSSLVGLVALLLFLSRRDRMRSERLDADLIKRRRSRRLAPKA